MDHKAKSESEFLPGEPAHAFDLSKALDNKDFLKFIGQNSEEIDPESPEYLETMERTFSVFKNSEEFKAVFVKTLKEKFKKETGIVLSDQDFEDISGEVAREAMDDPESLANKLDILKAYNELPGEIERLESEIGKIGDAEALESKRSLLEKNREDLKLASQVGFVDRMVGGGKNDVFNLEDYIYENLDKEYGNDGRSVVLCLNSVIGTEAKGIEDLVGVLKTDKEGIKDSFLRIVNDEGGYSPWQRFKGLPKGGIDRFVDRLISLFDEAKEKEEEIDLENKQKEAYRVVDKEINAGYKGYFQKLRTRLVLPQIIKERLSSIESEIVKLDKQISGGKELATRAEDLKTDFDSVKASLFEMYPATAKIVEKVKEKVKKKFEDSLSGKDEKGAVLKSSAREKRLDEVRAFLDSLEDSEAEYLSDIDLSKERDSIQNGLESLVEEEVEAIINGINVDQDGAYTKALKPMVAFLMKRGQKIGEKDGQDAVGVIRSAVMKKIGAPGFNRAKKILITEVLRRQGVRLS